MGYKLGGSPARSGSNGRPRACRPPPSWRTVFPAHESARCVTKLAPAFHRSTRCRAMRSGFSLSYGGLNGRIGWRHGASLRDSVFEPHDIKAMSMALDDVCAALKLRDGTPSRPSAYEAGLAEYAGIGNPRTTEAPKRPPPPAADI